jgi:hypothetical protein
MSGHTPTAQYEYDYRPGRRRHPLRTTIIVLIVIVGLLVGADFGARAYAENRVASQIQQQGFPQRPSVTIDGFPFLTQLISRHFGEVQISSANLTEGPLLIQSIQATMNGIHIHSGYNGATVSQLTGTINVTFAALGNAMTTEAGGLESLINGSLSLSAASSDEVKATLQLEIGSETVVWRVTPLNGNKIQVQMVSNQGLIPSSLLSSIGTVTIPVQQLPLGLSIQSITVTPAGLTGTITGQNVSFGS